jgi:RNA polymerase sigma-70 factor (ECF subfamily)
MALGPRIQHLVASVFSASATTEQAPALDVAGVHERHAEFVWRSLQRLGVRTADLEDALQEVFIVVHRRLSTFDGSARMTTWLFGISLRVAAAHRRRAHVRRETPTAELDDEPDENPGTSPEASALAAESRRQLTEVLDTLSAEKRSAFVMFEIEGLTATEIAKMLGIPVGTVYSRLASARIEFTEAVARLARRRKAGGWT